MFSPQAKQAGYLLALIDGLLLVLAFYLAFAFRALVPLGFLEDGSALDLSAHVGLLFLAVPVFLLLATAFGVYDPSRITGRAELAGALARVFLYTLALLGTAVFLFQLKAFSRAVFFLFLCFAFFLVSTVRLSLFALDRRRRRAPGDQRSVLIVGTGSEATDIRRKLDSHPEFSMRVTGHLLGPGEALSDGGPGPVLGVLQDLKRIVEEKVVDDVVFALPFAEVLACHQEIGWCEEVGITVHLRADFVRTIFARTYATDIDGTPLLTISAIPRDALLLLAKRVVDFSASMSMLVLLSPFMLLAAIAIRATSRGPVFFRQSRVGLNGRTFVLYKFRSMSRDAEDRRLELESLNEMSGPVFKMQRDPRITAVGRFLRRLSFDEVPQLWNVLRGDMSLVGPRPPLPDEVRRYVRWQRRRLSMKPGLTCLWQVSGRNRVDFDDWMRMDLSYIDNWSLKLDFEILLRTLPAVISTRGAR
jgi:exopolysaccharide biosynthesis polyprenyl glycosylphosphotransferase